MLTKEILINPCRCEKRFAVMNMQHNDTEKEQDLISKQNTAEGANYPLPWDRFWARWIDLFIHLFISCFIFILFVYDPSLDVSKLNTGIIIKRIIIVLVMAFVAFIVYETFFLCLLATTPGKALFGISVLGSNGKKLNVRAAVVRAVSLYASCLYFYILPTIGPFLGFWLSSYYYTRNGRFVWDKLSDCVVCQKTISKKRRNISRLFSILFIVIRHAPETLFLYEALISPKI
jgi:uncharacterized RDD family membrane protein YckC